MDWRSKITDYYRFALTRTEIDGLLCAPQNAEQIQALAEGLSEGPLTEDQERRMLELGALVRQARQGA